MKCKLLKTYLPLLFLALLAGCAGLMGASQSLTFTPTNFPSGQYTAKADNFQLIMDASQTMANNGQANFLTAKNFVSAVNQSLPVDFDADMGLRSYGHSEKQSPALTELVAPMAKYSRAAIQQGVDKVKYAGGNSPLGAAIDGAAADLEKTAGSAVLVIVSDGTQNNMDDAVAAAKAIKAKMGERLCIYTVWVGEDESGRKLLEKVAQAGGCGSAESAGNLTNQKSLAAFVEKVFLDRKPAPAPVAAPAPAPAPASAPVPSPAAAPAPCQGVITANLVFDFDKAVIKDEMIPVLEEAKRIMGECRAANYQIAGHTCSIGTDAYNQKLSERRAAAVRSWLVDNGVDSNRLEAVGYGEGSPKYDNGTMDGRKLNRRVEFQAK